MPKKPVDQQAAKKRLPQPSEPASIAPIVEHHERKIAEARAAKKPVDQQAAEYMPTRGKIDDPLRNGADSILRAVEKGGGITLETLTELLDLLRTKTDYHFHVEVAVQRPKSALLQTIDNERDAKETIRRLRTKP
jgi:hypothetical protein